MFKKILPNGLIARERTEEERELRNTPGPLGKTTVVPAGTTATVEKALRSSMKTIQRRQNPGEFHLDKRLKTAGGHGVHHDSSVEKNLVGS